MATRNSSGTLGRWTAACAGVLDALVFPWSCAVCEAACDGPFCEPCRAELLGASGRCCRRCAMPVGPHVDVDGGCSDCRGKSLGFEAAFALGPYQGPIRSLCLGLKRESNAWMGRHLGDLLAEVHGGAIAAAMPARVVPVPLHWLRRVRRGYNQATGPAEALARWLGRPVSHPLWRASNTKALAGASRTERASRMKGAFRVRRGWDLRGETVVLVDDILTSGATCGAAARALKQAGAKRVIVAVVGRADGVSRTPGAGANAGGG
jgi:ComF family protein